MGSVCISLPRLGRLYSTSSNVIAEHFICCARGSARCIFLGAMTSAAALGSGSNGFHAQVRPISCCRLYYAVRASS